MRLLPALALSPLLLTLPSAAALADRPSELIDPFASAPGPWQSGAKARALLRPWASCEMQSAALAPAEQGETVRARRVGRDVDVERTSAGSGRWATAITRQWRLEGGTCMGAGVAALGGKASLWASLALVSAGLTSTLTRAAEMNDAIVVAEQRGPELAAARLLLQLTRTADDTAELVAVPAEPLPPAVVLAPEELAAQPPFAGAPRGGPATLWSPLAMQLAGVPLGDAPEELKPEGGANDGVLIAAIRAPRVLLTKGRWQLWELRFRARLGGGLLAVYDRQQKQHRWVLATEQDDGRRGHFDVVGLRDELALVRTTHDETQRLWVIDLSRGAVRRVLRRGPYRLVGDQLEVSGHDGSRERLPLASLRP